MGTEPTVVQFPRHCMGAYALIQRASMHLLHDQHLCRINRLILYQDTLFIGAPLVNQTVTVLHPAAREDARFSHLLDAGGGLAGFSGRLPESDVVQQIVNMIVEFLLPLAGTPDLDALFDDPLHNEGRFVLTASKPVEHEDK